MNCKSTPLISVVIPVYNVEKYLRECLDSVVNQTLRDIQIICVNDGSPDNSRAILQEYADKDSRIQIIDKPNGGLSSARNAAYPFLNGKYTLFVDSDDWISLDLCEKVYSKAEKSGAELTCFYWQQNAAKIIWRIGFCDKITADEKKSAIFFTSAWSKLCRTDFLLNNALTFPDGLVYEDTLFSWKAVTLARKIAIVPEKLYYYRVRPGSLMNTKNEHSLDIIPIYNLIGEFLRTSGFYLEYQHKYLSNKLDVWYRHYRNLPSDLRVRYVEMIRYSLCTDDWEFLRSKECRKTIRIFYQTILGTAVNQLKAKVLLTIIQTGGDIERGIRNNVIRPIKKCLKAA